MLMSCILVSHNKPDLCQEAIASVVGQAHAKWQCVVVDSGALYDQGYFERKDWIHDERLAFVRSTESEATRRTKAMAPWCFNECIRKGLVRGDLVMYLCDDDILYPNAFQSFVQYAGRRPDVLAMYASQDIGIIYPDGRRAIVGERRAYGLGGRCCHGRALDCEVDYLQFCHRRELLGRFAGDQWWPEDKNSESHADGLFLERCGEIVPIYPLDVKVSQNRRTPRSTYVPVKRGLLGWLLGSAVTAR
jgi:glycosyltransferase involved in cell wall biosynthesis